MFEARCPSCAATYQVDERRVPPKGLKMRCPKCGESFHVSNPATESAPPVLGAALGLSPQAGTPPARKATMIGVAEQGGAEVNRPPPLKREAPKQTMLGVAPARPLELAQLDDDVVSDRAGIEFELPTAVAPDSDELTDLPSPVSMKGKSSIIDLPSIAPTSIAPSSRPGVDSGEFDLDASLSDPGPSGDLDLPGLGGDLDLPDLSLDSPRPRAREFSDLPDLDVELPDLGAGLPNLEARLPDLGAGLPDLGAGLPDAESGQRHPGPPPARRSPQSVQDLDEFTETIDSDRGDLFGSPLDVGAVHSQQTSSHGELDFGDGGVPSDDGEFDAFPTENAASNASGNAGYGDVSLEGGGDDLDLGAELDRAPVDGGMSHGPAAAASAMIDRSQAARPEQYSKSKDKKKKKERQKTTSLSKGTRIAIVSVLGVAVAGGALASLLPDVGPYGSYFVIDQLKADEYKSHLARDVADAQKRMSLDTAAEVSFALKDVKRGLQRAPRFKPRAAYAAYIGFFHQIRFGAASDESAQAQSLLEGLKEPDPTTHYLDLALLAQKATAHPEVPVDQAKQLLPRGVEFAVIVGEAALARRNAAVASEAWAQVLKAENSARSNFGMARAMQLSGQDEEAQGHILAALKANPKHVGARILHASLLLKDRTQDEAIVSEITPLSEGGDGASRGEQVQALVVLGDLHLMRARLKKAEQAFEQALEKNAGSAPAQRGLAKVLFDSGRYSEALARYESALSVEPSHLETNLGVVQCKLRLEQLDDAVKILTKLAPLHPKSTAIQYFVGKTKEETGEKDPAQAAYENAIELNEPVPELVQSYIALTRLLGQQGKQVEAEALIARAEQTFPNDPAIYAALGELSANRGSFDEAVKHFDRAITLDPKNTGLHFSRGIALRQARRFDEAASEFDLVEKESRDYPGLALERGNLFETSGQSEAALKAYERALAEAPDDLDLKLRVACGKASAGKGKEVVEQLKPLLEARPNSAEVNFCQGLALLNLGQDLPLARTYLERAMSRDPSRAKHHLYVGWVNLEIGDLTAANRALNQAISLDTTLADAYYKRGELRVKQRAVRDALVDLNRALELAPSRVEVHAQKALAFLELGQEPQAIAEFELAVHASGAEPAWHYRYGDLLLANRRPLEAAEQLKLAIEKAKSRETEPVWLHNAHRLLALSLGRKKEALEHWKIYVNAKQGTNDPYLAEAAREMDAILRSLGH